MPDDHALMAEVWEKLGTLWMRLYDEEQRLLALAQAANKE